MVCLVYNNHGNVFGNPCQLAPSFIGLDRFVELLNTGDDHTVCKNVWQSSVAAPETEDAKYLPWPFPPAIYPYFPESLDCLLTEFVALSDPENIGFDHFIPVPPGQQSFNCRPGFTCPRW